VPAEEIIRDVAAHLVPTGFLSGDVLLVAKWPREGRANWMIRVTSDDKATVGHPVLHYQPVLSVELPGPGPYWVHVEGFAPVRAELPGEPQEPQS
jgi:hypothetical protein